MLTMKTLIVEVNLERREKNKSWIGDGCSRLSCPVQMPKYIYLLCLIRLIAGKKGNLKSFKSPHRKAFYFIRKANMSIHPAELSNK